MVAVDLLVENTKHDLMEIDVNYEGDDLEDDASKVKALLRFRK
jgi:hypothetical protein